MPAIFRPETKTESTSKKRTPKQTISKTKTSISENCPKLLDLRQNFHQSLFAAKSQAPSPRTEPIRMQEKPKWFPHKRWTRGTPRNAFMQTMPFRVPNSRAIDRAWRLWSRRLVYSLNLIDSCWFDLQLWFYSLTSFRWTNFFPFLCSVLKFSWLLILYCIF